MAKKKSAADALAESILIGEGVSPEAAASYTNTTSADSSISDDLANAAQNAPPAPSIPPAPAMPELEFPEIEFPPIPPPPDPVAPLPSTGQGAETVYETLRKRRKQTPLSDRSRQIGRMSTILTGPGGSTGSSSAPGLSGILVR